MAIEPTTTTAVAAALAERLIGHVIAPEQPEYDSARRLWNGMIDKRPAAIARCADETDVAEAIRFATEHDLPLAVRGGGHNVAGTASVDHGTVIDLSAMRSVRIDPSRRTVHVQGGATWADVDRVTAPLGLATPGGVVSETGVAGLALSGGVSHQRRRDGMTIDNLVSAEVVLADGRRVRASADEHADLHWALRGGGGNFGVVTSFELRLHELGPQVYGLNVAYPIEDAARVLAGWRDAVADAPDELSTAGFIWSMPVDDALPDELRGAPYAGVVGMWAGHPDEGERATRELRELASPLLDMSGPVEYLDFQSSLDPFFPAGVRRYWKALYLDGFSDAAIDTTVDWANRRPSSDTLVIVRHCERSDGPRGRRGRRVRRPQLRVDAQHRLELARPRRRRRQRRLHARVLGRRSPVLGRQDLLQLPRLVRGGRRRRARQLRRQPRPAGLHQGRLRPGQRLPPQPEHPPRRLTRPPPQPARSIP